MAKFGSHSMRERATCHPDIVALADSVIEYRNCRIIYGWRGPVLQNDCFRNGFSNKRWPNSMHNAMGIDEHGIVTPLSLAADIMPFFPSEPNIRWEDTVSIYEFCGYVKARADMIGIGIIHGYDWDNDLDFHDQTLMDGAHYQRILGRGVGIEIIKSNDNSITDIKSIPMNEIPEYISVVVKL